MARRLEACAAARGVASVAVTGTAGVMRPGAANEGCRGMAKVAIETGGYMIGRLGGRVNAMAGSAVIDDAGMVEGCRDEADRGMADAAILVGGNVVGLFWRGEPGIVTGSAVIDDADMIEG